MNLVKFTEIMQRDIADWKGDNVYKGLQIIAKYVDPERYNIVTGSSQDILYSVKAKILANKITEESAICLRQLNWMINDDYIACYT